MKPLAITLTLARKPIVLGDDLLHLDGVLAWLVARQRADQGSDTMRTPDELPLAREQRGNAWCYKASAFAFYGVEFGGALELRRSAQDFAFALTSPATKAPNIKVFRDEAQYKMWNLRFPFFYASKACAWCIGDEDAIRRVIRDLRYIGKLARLGCGQVLRVGVQYDERAHELWQYRHLPWPQEDYAQIFGRCTPPYWDRIGFSPSCWRPVFRLSMRGIRHRV
ncbi:MAG: hypothetical protein D6771_09565 [Zetaproteobacteria bacterium]|nr:MAG: hypothetical protein D6771_09565 [Zetaproteobacteria bacterium]